MKHRHLLLATLLVAASALPAHATLRMLEQGVETSASMLLLPQRPDGTLQLRACPGCALQTLQASAATLYIVGRQSVTLAEFAALLRDHPDLNVSVFRAQNTMNVTRVKVATPPRVPAPPANRNPRR